MHQIDIEVRTYFRVFGDGVVELAVCQSMHPVVVSSCHPPGAWSAAVAFGFTRYLSLNWPCVTCEDASAPTSITWIRDAGSG